MSQVIKRYKINTAHQSSIDMPIGAEILSVAVGPYNGIVLYARSSETALVKRTFLPFNSGRDIPNNKRVRFDYIGTIHRKNAEECHILERIDLLEK
jgi:hypothetical protein